MRKSDLGGKPKYGGDTYCQWQGGFRCKLKGGNNRYLSLKRGKIVTWFVNLTQFKELGICGIFFQ